ncbi:hypothetical protein [Burkholderia pyrrocinia]|uniref:hypothetical protein n=1 Tax=Burkholderia pyrrocinia TaxID=60550 RepID=UPI0030D5D9C5
MALQFIEPRAKHLLKTGVTNHDAVIGHLLQVLKTNAAKSEYGKFYIGITRGLRTARTGMGDGHQPIAVDLRRITDANISFEKTPRRPDRDPASGVRCQTGLHAGFMPSPDSRGSVHATRARRSHHAL